MSHTHWFFLGGRELASRSRLGRLGLTSWTNEEQLPGSCCKLHVKARGNQMVPSTGYRHKPRKHIIVGFSWGPFLGLMVIEKQMRSSISIYNSTATNNTRLVSLQNDCLLHPQDPNKLRKFPNRSGWASTPADRGWHHIQICATASNRLVLHVGIRQIGWEFQVIGTALQKDGFETFNTTVGSNTAIAPEKGTPPSRRQV